MIPLQIELFGCFIIRTISLNIFPTLLKTRSIQKFLKKNFIRPNDFCQNYVTLLGLGSSLCNLGGHKWVTVHYLCSWKLLRSISRGCLAGLPQLGLGPKATMTDNVPLSRARLTDSLNFTRSNSRC